MNTDSENTRRVWILDKWQTVIVGDWGKSENPCRLTMRTAEDEFLVWAKDGIRREFPNRIEDDPEGSPIAGCPVLIDWGETTYAHSTGSDTTSGYLRTRKLTLEERERLTAAPAVTIIKGNQTTPTPTKADIKRVRDAKRYGRLAKHEPKDGEDNIQKAVDKVIELRSYNKSTSMTMERACRIAIKEFMLTIKWQALAKHVRNSPKWETLKKKIRIARK